MSPLPLTASDGASAWLLSRGLQHCWTATRETYEGKVPGNVAGLAIIGIIGGLNDRNLSVV